MIVAWMAYALVVSVLVALGAKGAEAALRALGVPTRFVWLVALAGTVALGAAGPLRSSGSGTAATGPLIEAAAPSAEAGAAPTAGSSVGYRLGVTLAGARRVLAWPVRAAAASPAGGAGGVLSVVWLVLVSGMMAVGAATLLRYRGARRHWPLCDIQGVRARVAPAAGPAVLGVVRPEIVVPGWLLARSPGEQRLVVVHEREHLRARDPLTLTAGWLATALIPWNPLLWWMLGRLRLAVELDCDARVLRQGVHRRIYGSMLIETAGRGAGLSPAAVGLGGSRTTLERRLMAMTTPWERKNVVRAATLGAIGALALVAACEARMPTAAEIDDLDAASAEMRAEQAGMLAAGNDSVSYYVDGTRVSAEQAHAMESGRIAKVEVARATGESGPTIQMWTHEAVEAGLAPADPGGGATLGADGATPDSTVVLLRPEAGAGSVMIRRNREPKAAAPQEEFDGLLLIDGVPADASVLREMDSSRIESIEVIKGGAAVRLYDDPRAANGVIRVTTKAGEESRAGGGRTGE